MLIAADYSDVQRLGEELLAIAGMLSSLTPELSKARTVRDYDGDRRKRALSRSVSPYLIAGESAAAAEHKARGSEMYAKDMKRLRAEFESAEEVIARHDALRVRWESVRSLLSIQKSLANNLHG